MNLEHPHNKYQGANLGYSEGGTVSQQKTDYEQMQITCYEGFQTSRSKLIQELTARSLRASIERPVDKDLTFAIFVEFSCFRRSDSPLISDKISLILPLDFPLDGILRTTVDESDDFAYALEAGCRKTVHGGLD